MQLGRNSNPWKQPDYLRLRYYSIFEDSLLQAVHGISTGMASPQSIPCGSLGMMVYASN
jgi:hypothetical protein